MFTPEEKKAIRLEAAMELMRFLSLLNFGKGLSQDDINAVLVAAGEDVITPAEFDVRQFKIKNGLMED